MGNFYPLSSISNCRMVAVIMTESPLVIFISSGSNFMSIGDTAERVKISHNVPQEGIILEYGKDAFTVKENETVEILIFVDKTVPDGTYKAIIGADTGDVAVSSYVDIQVRS